MSERPIKLYLEDIREAIGKIESYTKGITFAQFKNDLLNLSSYFDYHNTPPTSI